VPKIAKIAFKLVKVIHGRLVGGSFFSGRGVVAKFIAQKRLGTRGRPKAEIPLSAETECATESASRLSAKNER